MVSYGFLAVANNDLALRFKNGSALNSTSNVTPSDIPKLFFGPGNVPEGYTDLKPYEPKAEWSNYDKDLISLIKISY